MPGFPQPAALTRREAKCLCAKRNAHRQSPKKLFPGKRSPSPRRCPTRQRQRPISDSHCQEALHSLHARLVQAPSCAEICAQGVHLISGQLELEDASRKCQAKQWRVCRKQAPFNGSPSNDQTERLQEAFRASLYFTRMKVRVSLSFRLPGRRIASLGPL